jgi:CRISPR-associated endonuclease/helicase Cas3
MKLRLKNIFGRTRDSDGKKEPLVKHLKNTSKLAAKFCARFGAKKWGEIAGLFHDGGKCSLPFQRQLDLPKKVDYATRGARKIDHATWGAHRLFYNVGGIAGHLLASIICGHHGGIPNALNGQSRGNSLRTPLRDRLEKTLPFIEEEYVRQFDSIKIGKLKYPKDRFSRYVFSKMIHSSLVDADRLDSERYNNPHRSALRKYDQIKTLKKLMCKHMKKHVYNQENPSEIDKIRTEVQKHCHKMAWIWWNPFSWNRRLFTLTVPTGGGKTLASMLFALCHASKRNLDRIIYVLPYTTIIEQNAEEFRKILGPSNVIEHHCHFEQDILGEKEYTLKQHHRLATENWDAPVIVTTNVQFFESLFNNGARRSRKLHNITNSIIILDEVHLLPSRLLKPCIKVLKEYIERYNCTVLFCTATQPGLFKTNGFKWGLNKATELADDPSKLYQALERVKYEFKPNVKTDDQMARLVKKFPKVITVVNTRRHARILYEDIKSRGNAYHLSTLMCAHHRKKILREVIARLKSPFPCRLVSTQLIECGVNITSPVVVRNVCGVGSLIQTAGRCNRNGELGKEMGRLIITNVTGNNQHTLSDDFSTAAEEIAKKYIKSGKNILDCDTSQQAFVELFKNLEDRLDKPRNEKSLLDYIEDHPVEIPYETISELFKIIETSVESIIVPYNEEARKLVEKLREDPGDFTVVRALQSFTVQAYPSDLEKISYAIDTHSAPPYRILADMTLYSYEFGLNVFSQQSLNDARL